jgi:hypothetical protein
MFDIDISGELGIRTPGTFHSSTVFKTAAIDHSASSPGTKVQNRADLANLMLTFFKLICKLLDISLLFYLFHAKLMKNVAKMSRFGIL